MRSPHHLSYWFIVLMGPPERVTCPQHQGKMGSLCLKGNFEIESYVHINKIKMISLGASIKKKAL